MEVIRRSSGWLRYGDHKHAKRIHRHALPLIVAVLIATVLSAVAAGAMHEGRFATSLLRPVLGLGVAMAIDGQLQASLRGVSAADEPAGVVDKLNNDATEVISGRQAEGGPVGVLFEANRSLALQMALQDVARAQKQR